MLWDEFCPTNIHTEGGWRPNLQYFGMCLFGDKAFNEVIKMSMGPDPGTGTTPVPVNSGD